MLTALLLTFSLIFTEPTEVADKLGIKQVEFNGTTYDLGWTSHPRDDYYIQEYFPKGETPEKFTRMMTVQVLRQDVELHQAVMDKMKELEQRKLTDALCQYALTESPDSKEFILDFLVSDAKDDKLGEVEFNIYHYTKAEIGGKPALVLYFYTAKSFGDDITPFMEGLGTQRVELLNRMAEMALPAVTL
jgi:hypothetical protein